MLCFVDGAEGQSKRIKHIFIVFKVKAAAKYVDVPVS